ncbi:hypothetical protein C5472_22150 [Photorhabdus sp. RW14-46]|nr:hypothetical protein [Photorhabdus sp. RW14-46]
MMFLDFKYYYIFRLDNKLIKLYENIIVVMMSQANQQMAMLVKFIGNKDIIDDISTKHNNALNIYIFVFNLKYPCAAEKQDRILLLNKKNAAHTRICILNTATLILYPNMIGRIIGIIAVNIRLAGIKKVPIFINLNNSFLDIWIFFIFDHLLKNMGDIMFNGRANIKYP